MYPDELLSFRLSINRFIYSHETKQKSTNHFDCVSADFNKQVHCVKSHVQI